MVVIRVKVVKVVKGDIRPVINTLNDLIKSPILYFIRVFFPKSELYTLC